MNWLYLLLPISGLLAWAWDNHLLHVAFNDSADWWALPLALVFGPLTILVVCYAALAFGVRGQLWGLRFR